MNTILFLWTVVFASGSAGQYPIRDWRPIGEFSSPAACEAAIRQLGIDPKAARCVAK